MEKIKQGRGTKRPGKEGDVLNLKEWSRKISLSEYHLSKILNDMRVRGR